jgi:hypothetical protein
VKTRFRRVVHFRQTLALGGLAAAFMLAPAWGAARNSVTAESLPGEMAKARQKLQTIAPPPADIPAATLEKLRAKSLGMNLQDDNLALWEIAARSNDFVKVGALGYRAAELVTRGRIRLQPPQPGAKGSRMPGPSPKLMEKAWGLNLNEQATPEDQIRMADAAHATGKKFTVAPTGERLLSWGEAKVGELARHVDLFVIQAERWMYEDHSPGKQDYVSKVLRFSRAIRAANPQCEVFIELGRRLDRGGGAADELLRALALLCEKDPGSFDGFQPFITRQDTDDPKQGIGALYHLMAWLRPEALAASPNREPAGFAKPIAHDAEFFPTTKA